jgi:hypothetical protein
LPRDYVVPTDPKICSLIKQINLNDLCGKSKLSTLPYFFVCSNGMGFELR